MKLSIVVPVYYNAESLIPLYEEIIEVVKNKINEEYEIVLVNDGSKDDSYKVMKHLALQDRNVKIISLSRNFGSHAAILCGLSHSTGDCAVVKAADLQEPTELIIDMLESWKKGNNVVLAEREGRPEGKGSVFFSNLYYWLVRKVALPTMPKSGFDIFLLDRKVIEVLSRLDEVNSALTGQILWSGFKTDTVSYIRKERAIGESKWTLRKKIKLVTDTMFSFSTLPITIVSVIGTISFGGATIWALIVLIFKLLGKITVTGWTTLFIFNLFSFGIIMLTLGILGGYLWRTFDAARRRPPYIIEETNELNIEKNSDEM